MDQRRKSCTVQNGFCFISGKCFFFNQLDVSYNTLMVTIIAKFCLELLQTGHFSNIVLLAKLIFL